jgi:hypothetical protein
MNSGSGACFISLTRLTPNSYVCPAVALLIAPVRYNPRQYRDPKW